VVCRRELPRDGCREAVIDDCRGFCFSFEGGFGIGGGGISCVDLSFLLADGGSVGGSGGGGGSASVVGVGGGGSFPGVGDRGIDSACGFDILLCYFRQITE
jgi:hypothetical protein